MEFNKLDPRELKSRKQLALKLLTVPARGPTLPKLAAAARRAGAAISPVQNVPFPAGLGPIPQPIAPAPDPSAALPKVDVIAMMDTKAEVQAMADVLTPGIASTKWYKYARNYESHYRPLVGPRGPSRNNGRLGSYFVTSINHLKVLCFKTELHLHADSKKMPDGTYSLPLKDMLAQIIAEAQPKVFLTTGTSGGVFCDMCLGDVVISRAARFICQAEFAAAPFNHTTYKSHWRVPRRYRAAAMQLMQTFADHLSAASHTPPPSCSCSSAARPPQLYFDGHDNLPAYHPILTVDFFEFGTSTNNLDKLGVAVEMDDAVLGLVCSEMSAPPRWASIRNLSDPTINGQLDMQAQKQCAGSYYQDYGYWTTVMSALATWSVVAGLKL